MKDAMDGAVERAREALGQDGGQDARCPDALKRVRENLRAGRELNAGIEPEVWRGLLDRYSRFVDRRDVEGFLCESEVVITRLDTPRPCLHLMASSHDGESGTWGSFWDPFGGGFSCLDSVLAGRMTSHLDTNYVPTAPEPQDVRSFYIHEAGRAWPMFLVPHFDEDQYRGITCVQGLDRHVMRAERAGLACELEVCVHPNRPLEVWSVRIRNTGDEPREFSWFTRLRVNVDSFPSYYFVPRVVCEGVLEDGSLVFLNHDQNNRHPRQAFFTAAPGFDGYDMMGEVFDGIGGRSPIPIAVVDGRCRNSPGLQPYAGLVAAAQFNARLEPGEVKIWRCVYGACPYDSGERGEYLRKVRAEVLGETGDVAASVRAVWAGRVRAAMIRTPDAELDRYFNIWSKYQARNQVRFCRALDKVGFRDVLQDMVGVCDFEPAYVRRLILRTLRYQSADGRAVRQYCLFPGVGHDLRMYMDSAAWIPDTLAQYVKETGDIALVDESVPYFDMQRQEPDASQRGSVYEHGMRAVRSLTGNTGYHGLCRIGYGDWNDALSGIGGEKGVSVWLSCAAVYAAGKMEALATHLGRSDDAREMREAARSLTDCINEHAWDGEWYIYAINGQGRPIGSRQCPEGHIHLNVNTWALFTGVAAAAGREERVWGSLERLAMPLGHMLLAPPYTHASRAEVGRIADQKPGLFENGSIYHHGEAFYLYALIDRGRPDDCYREMMRTIPSAMVQDIATGPRHQQSNFTVGPDHPSYGAQLFSNFTGSVSWYRRVIERMMGVIADFDQLRLTPCPPSSWDEYEVHRVWRGRQVRVRVRRSPSEAGRITLDGRTYQGGIPCSALAPSGVNRVEVAFG